MSKYSRPDKSDRDVTRVTNHLYDSINKLSDKISVNAFDVASFDKRLTVLERIGWKEIVIPAHSIYVVSTGKKPTVSDAFDKWLGTLLFEPNADILLNVQVEMPQDWETGTDIYIHVHWTKTTADAGDVYWQYIISTANPGEEFSSETTNGSFTVNNVTGSDYSEADWHLITPLPVFSMAGKTSNCILLMQISRVGTNGDDDYAYDARLLSIDIHYKVNINNKKLNYIN